MKENEQKEARDGPLEDNEVKIRKIDRSKFSLF